MKPYYTVGVLIFRITFRCSGKRLIIGQHIIVTTTIVFIHISSIGSHLHIGGIALNNYYFLFLYLLLFFLNFHRFILCRIGIDIIPFLCETQER